MGLMASNISGMVGTTLNSFFEKEILGYKSRANCIDQAKNKAIGCFFIVTASVAGIVATKLNKEKIKDVHQKLIVGVCATLLTLSTVSCTVKVSCSDIFSFYFFLVVKTCF